MFCRVRVLTDIKSIVLEEVNIFDGQEVFFVWLIEEVMVGVKLTQVCSCKYFYEEDGDNTMNGDSNDNFEEYFNDEDFEAQGSYVV